MTIKKKLQKWLDNVDEKKLNKSFYFDISVDPAHIMLKKILKQCQKEPTLGDKLTEYICEKTGTCPTDLYSGEHCYTMTYTYYDILIHTANHHNKVLVQYNDYHELLCDTHEKVFDAIKLFEKWSQE